MGLLTNLSRLDLYDMVHLTGSFPSQIAHLSQLSVLFVASSFVNEIIFSSLLSHLPTSLESLSLYDMPFTGSIPPSIRYFHNLTELNLNSLTLSGTLPTEIGLLTNLIKLDFSYSKLDGEIPSELGRLTHMTGLYVDGTNFEKPFPSEVLQMPGLITNH
jgi:Leucine-rich repeat (LRR) protein